MKNVLFILVISWLFIACDNQQDELHKNDELNKNSVIRTRVGYNDTIVFPYCSYSLDFRGRKVYLSMSEPSSQEYEQVRQKYPEISTYPPYWSECYIQYRTYKYGTTWDTEWYYYHPDTIRCKSPYKIKLDNNLDTVLDPSKFPYSEFQYRAQLIGKNGDYFNYITRSMEPGEYSLINMSRNDWGFSENGGNQTGQAGSVEIVSIHLKFDFILHLDARNNQGFKYTLKFENQKSPEFSVGFDRTDVFFYTFEKYETLYNVPINSVQYYPIHFEGKVYYAKFYIDPNHIQRGYELHYTQDVYISSDDLKYK